MFPASAVFRGCLIVILWAGLLAPGCVVSNLDNAFDPTTPLGLSITVLSQASSGGTSESTSNSPGAAAATCDASAATSTGTTDYTVAGSYTQAIAADVLKVELTVIGGGGGGGEVDVMNDLVPIPCSTYCNVNGETGGSSAVDIQGGANLMTVTGGGGGVHSHGTTTLNAPALQGSVGTGGSPAGVNGSIGTVTGANQKPAGGQISGYTAGMGGAGGTGGVDFGLSFYGGPGGGSGGIDTMTLSANSDCSSTFAGRTLDITVGAGGHHATTADGKTNAAYIATSGNDGLVRVEIFQ